MAITRHLAELILAEHRFRNIRGPVLLLGRQSVFMTADEAQQLVEKAGLAPSPKAHVEYCRTAHGKKHRYISDVSFFSLFTDAPVVACDVSDYEGADIVFDLCGSLPAQMVGAYDFVYNGSVLDNVFDPAACMRNVSRMLKPDGVVMHYEGSAHCGAAYLKFSPDWFFDYYALNGFADAQVYLGVYRDIHASPWSVFEWSPFTVDGGAAQLPEALELRSDAVVIAVAQNQAGATADKSPIQNVYRGDDHRAYLAAYSRFATSKRRQVIAASLDAPPHATSAIRLSALRKIQNWLDPTRLPSERRGNQFLGTLGKPRPPEVWS